MTTRLVVAHSDEMEALGARLAALLAMGDLVVLDGPLGAGKTTLTRGIGSALGARGAVTSPTFVLAREHPTASGVPLVHVDAYRLGSARELDDLDLDYDGAIVVVEWGAGKLDGVAESWIDIAIARERSDDARDVTITGHGPRWGTLDHDLLDPR
jgi:tRNA threonylcarbamoyladenosine biosynthesis protein TsaE